MKKITLLLIALIFSSAMFAQTTSTAPRTRIGSVLGVTGQQIEVPIVILDECNICSITLSISFRSKDDGLACLKFLRWKDEEIPGTMLNVIKHSTWVPYQNPNRQTMMITWVSPNGNNRHFSAGTIIATAIFEYISGDGNVIFLNYDGTGSQGDYKTCEYGYYDSVKKESYPLYDFPSEAFYLGGQIHEIQDPQ